MTLRLNGLEVDCVIGERPDERTRLQRLSLDVALEVDDRAAASDRLEDAADYAALAEGVRRALGAARCHLIERAAKVAADVFLADPAVRSAEVAVTKAGAVHGLASATAVWREGKGERG